MDDNATSLPLYRRAAEIARSALGENHQHYAIYLSNLAAAHRAIGEYASARQVFHQVLEIQSSALGENHPGCATSLSALASLCLAMGDVESARHYSRQSLEIRRSALGEAHPDYAMSLAVLGCVSEVEGDYASALDYYNRGAETLRATKGDGHPTYAKLLLMQAVVLARAGRTSESMLRVEQALSLQDTALGQVLAIGSERQRISYITHARMFTDCYLSILTQHFSESPSVIGRALDLVLRRKAVSAEALATQRDAILGGKYPELEPKLRQLNALRMQVARKTLAGPGPEGLESYKRKLAETNAEKEQAEAELAREIPEMNLEGWLRASDRRAVALALPEGTALVEFVRRARFSPRAAPARGEPRNGSRARYVAFVLPAAAPDDVQMIDLGQAEPIDGLVADFRAGIIAEAAAGGSRDMTRRRAEARSTAEGGPGQSLRATVFDTLARAINSRTRLLIAPDGDLARLPFEVLPTVDGRCLIDAYQISYVTSGRDVLRFAAAVTGQPGDPLVVAERLRSRRDDPDRSGSPSLFWPRLLGRGKKAVKTPRPSVPIPETAACPAGRQSRDLDRDRSDYHFHRLPGTRVEGERVATRLGVFPWLDATAMEGRLKTACRSPQILHLATHGFFLPDQQRDLNREGRGLGFDIAEFSDAQGGLTWLSGPMMENPMLRSGLALAGANTWLRAGNPPQEAEDGLLTAEDVTGLDLLATELVVLSACETGLGRVHAGEGVFGLRRAFVLAGAKTLVMSLWKVPDEQTGELMEDLYRRLLAGEGRVEALRKAQLVMKKKYPDPYYWGSFICQGDPSPLGIHGR